MNIKERISQFENNERIILETELRNVLDQRHIKLDQEKREFNELRQVEAY